MVIWGTGTPRREFLHVDDCADACVHLMKVYSDAEHDDVEKSGREVIRLNIGWGVVRLRVGAAASARVDESMLVKLGSESADIRLVEQVLDALQQCGGARLHERGQGLGRGARRQAHHEKGKNQANREIENSAAEHVLPPPRFANDRAAIFAGDDSNLSVDLHH